VGRPTSCTAPDFSPARARACEPTGAQFESGSVQGVFSPRAPARLRLRRQPVAVAGGEVLLLHICLETTVGCFAAAFPHEAGGPPFAWWCVGAAAMG
jgi:hypothetical protein